MRRLGHGQVWWADLGNVRPVVVLTRASLAGRLRRVVVAPVTTTVRGVATEIEVGQREGLEEDCVINVDNLQLVDTDALVHQAGELDYVRWAEVCTAVGHMMSCPT